MAEQAAATTGTGGMFGTNFKWDDLTKMLGGFMKKPENQKMIMKMIEPLTQVYDPRTSKMVGGVGTGMLRAGSAIINEEEVGKTAAAQALREQVYNQKRLEQQQEILKLLAGQQAGQQAGGPVPSRLAGAGGAGWGFGLGGQQFPDRSSSRLAPTETDQQRRYKMAQGGY